MHAAIRLWLCFSGLGRNPGKGAAAEQFCPLCGQQGLHPLDKNQCRPRGGLPTNVLCEMFGERDIGPMNKNTYRSFGRSCSGRVRRIRDKSGQAPPRRRLVPRSSRRALDKSHKGSSVSDERPHLGSLPQYFWTLGCRSQPVQHLRVDQSTSIDGSWLRKGRST